MEKVCGRRSEVGLEGSENNLKFQRTHVVHLGHLPMRSFNTGTLSLSFFFLFFFPEKQPAFFSQREFRALCACSAAAFRFRSPCRVFTKGPRNSIILRGRSAEFGSVQPLSSLSGIQCHLTKAASNYIFLSRYSTHDFSAHWQFDGMWPTTVPDEMQNMCAMCVCVFIVFFSFESSKF